MTGTVSWLGAERIQWACTLMELLGEESLEHLPLLMNGTRAAETGYQVRGHEVAVRNTRRHLGMLLTRRAVQKSVRNLHTQARESRRDCSYIIDAETLAFRRAPGQDARIAAAQAALTAPHQRRAHGVNLAPLGDLTVRLHADTTPIDVPLRLAGLHVPPPAQHQLGRRPDRNLQVTLSDLRANRGRARCLRQGRPVEARGMARPA